MSDKILLFCPTYDDAMQPETKRSMSALIYPAGVQVDICISKDNPFGHTGNGLLDHQNTLHQYQVAERKTVEGGYAAIVTLEHDMVIPPDGLLKLWETPADVVYGLYVFRTHPKVVNAFRLESGTGIGSSLSLYPEDLAKAKAKGMAEVGGCGFGFTLVRRTVFDTVHIRHPLNGSHPAPDVQFAVDCMRAGKRQVCRFDLHCGHIHHGEILYPEYTEGVMTVKILVLRDVNVSVRGRVVALQAGQTTDIPHEAVDDLVRAGYVRLIDAAPAVKIVTPPKSAPKAVKK